MRGLHRQFLQDNARPHTARITTEYFQQHNVEVLPWPTRSPHLSPIERVGHHGQVCDFSISQKRFEAIRKSLDSNNLTPKNN